MTQVALLLPATLAVTLTLLTACGSPSTDTGTPDTNIPDTSILGTGTASLGGVLVQGSGQAAVVGSRVRLYLPGDRSHSVGQTTTTAGGQFTFALVPAGSYDLGFSKASFAASELRGAVATTAGLNYAVIQRPVRDPGGVLSVPDLAVKRTDSGEALSPGVRQTFVGRLPIDVQTTAASPHQRPLKTFEVSLLQQSGASFGELRPTGGTVNADPALQTTTQGADSGPLSLGTGSINGDALLQVAATDFNGNRAAQLYPINVTPPGTASGTAPAPQSVNAAAYTWGGPEATTEARVLWSMNSLVGVGGFEVWRSGAAAGPWTLAALAETAACTGSLCSIFDTSAGLSAGHDYFYKVTAVGQNRADSDVGAQPTTHVLPVFQPALVSPATGADGLPLNPVYTLASPAEQIGATGAIQQLSVQDDLLGSSTPWTATVQTRTVLGQANQAAGQADHQVLLLQGGRYVQVYSDLTPAGNVSGVAYDAASQRLSLTHNFDGSGQTLQPARRYRYTLGRSAAFRVQDPSRPPGATNPVVAYSVASDPAQSGPASCPAQPLVPGGPCLEGGPSLEFTTGGGQ